MTEPRAGNVLWLLLAAVALAGCGQTDGVRSTDQPSAAVSEDMPAAGVVRVFARDFAFEAPDELPSGWTTFHLENQGSQEHFMVLWKLPEGRTIADMEAEVMPAFDNAAYMAGEMDRGQYIEQIVSGIPEWYGGVVAGGGVGLLSPGHAAEATVELEPGHYVMECYVRTPAGEFHSAIGMTHAFTVTAEQSDAAPPEADIDLTLTNYAIGVEGLLTAGQHTARVSHADDPEGFVKHDIHLVRLEEGAGTADVVSWMDWIDAFMAPAPATFLGGSEDQPGGSTSYFTFRLEPGSYAWISEGYAAQGMVEEFEVE